LTRNIRDAISITPAAIYAPGKMSVAEGWDLCENAEGEGKERRWRAGG